MPPHTHTHTRASASIYKVKVQEVVGGEGERRLVCECNFSNWYRLPCCHVLAVSKQRLSLQDVHAHYLMEYLVGNLDYLIPELAPALEKQVGLGVQPDYDLSHPAAGDGSESDIELGGGDDDSTGEQGDGQYEEDTKSSSVATEGSSVAPEANGSVNLGQSGYFEFKSLEEKAAALFQKSQGAQEENEVLAIMRQCVRNMSAIYDEQIHTQLASGIGVLDPVGSVNNTGKGTSRRIRSKAEFVWQSSSKRKKAGAHSSQPSTRPGPMDTSASALTSATSLPTNLQSSSSYTSSIAGVMDPTEVKTGGRKKIRTVEEEVSTTATSLLVGRLRRPKAAEVQAQGTREWMLFRLGCISGQTAREVRVYGRGLGMAALKIFQLVHTTQTPAMKQGLERERQVIQRYLDAMSVGPNQAVLGCEKSFPAVCQHPEFPYLVYSPDALLAVTTATGKQHVLVEVKTTQTSGTEEVMRKCRDQIQLGLFVTGCERAVLLHCTNEMFEQKRLEVRQVSKSDEWVTDFKSKAKRFYDTYLSWYHQSPPSDRAVQQGMAVLKILHGTTTRQQIHWHKEKRSSGTRTSGRPTVTPSRFNS